MNKSTVTLYQDLLRQIDSTPLSQTLSAALRLARELKQTDFEKWLRLEVGGYINTNPVMTADVKVPEYRKVIGQHLDRYGRPFIVPSELQFLNGIPLRNGVSELEKLESKTEMLTVQDPLSIEFFREELGVEVVAFHFSPLEISGILSSMKLKLHDWLYDLQSSYPGLSRQDIKKIHKSTKTSQYQIWKTIVSIILLGFALAGFIWLPLTSAILWLIFLIVAYPVALAFTTAKQSMDNRSLTEIYKAGLRQVPVIGKLFGSKPSS